VADAVLKPDAPEIWDDSHIAARHNTLQNITALCPEGDITARLKIIGPDTIFSDNDYPDFMVKTSIIIESGMVGVYEWPFDLLEKFYINKGIVIVIFRGYNIDQSDLQNDFYSVQIQPAQQGDTPEPASPAR